MKHKLSVIPDNKSVLSYQSLFDSKLTSIHWKLAHWQIIITEQWVVNFHLTGTDAADNGLEKQELDINRDYSKSD